MKRNLFNVSQDLKLITS